MLRTLKSNNRISAWALSLSLGAIIFLVAANANAQPTGELCDNSCPWANDGECDDGGPMSLYDVCEFGTDCGDCGVRDPSAQIDVINPMSEPIEGGVCLNTCEHANDGECDDGGPSSMYNLCDYGTDCGDCGWRGPTPEYELDVTGQVCENTCAWAFDGECDDGGPMSLYDACGFGTDCGDCGPRDPMAATVPTMPSGTPPEATAEGDLCSNTCPWANDGECDDGGPMSLYDVCNFGTDCGDCGSRAVSNQ